MHVTKRIDLNVLQAELAAAGIAVPGLGHAGTDDDGELWTYQGTAVAELPAGAEPVVEAHVAPPRVVEHVEVVAVTAVTRTTDGAFREIWRLKTTPRHAYRAALEMVAIDATDGTTKAQEARLVFKGTAGSVVQVGATVVLWAAQDAPATGWAIQAQVQGTDLVFGVRGAAGKTIDWSLEGQVVTFSPEGLDA